MMRESEIQRKIIKKLEAAGWLVNKILSCSKPGWPDLEAYRNKVVVFIECKIPGKQARDLQLYRHRKLREQGFEVIVADDEKQVEHLTAESGFLKANPVKAS